MPYHTADGSPVTTPIERDLLCLIRDNPGIILADLHQMTGDRFSPSGFYQHIRRMETAKLVCIYPDIVAQHQVKRTYLTPLGYGAVARYGHSTPALLLPRLGYLINEANNRRPGADRPTADYAHLYLEFDRRHNEQVLARLTMPDTTRARCSALLHKLGEGLALTYAGREPVKGAIMIDEVAHVDAPVLIGELHALHAIQPMLWEALIQASRVLAPAPGIVVKAPLLEEVRERFLAAFQALGELLPDLDEEVRRLSEDLYLERKAAARVAGQQFAADLQYAMDLQKAHTEPYTEA